MIKINKFVLIICFLVLLLMFIICKNDIINVIKNLCNNSFVGGNTEESSILKDKINSRNIELEKMRAELESLRSNINNEKNNLNNTNVNNTNVNNTNVNSNTSNNMFRSNISDNTIKSSNLNNRQILENTNNDATQSILENDITLNNVTEDSEDINSDNINSDNITSEEIGSEDVPTIKNPVKPYEDMCEDDYNNKKKKSKYMDLKLELNTTSYLEPFNSGDYNEYGNFNC